MTEKLQLHGLPLKLAMEKLEAAGVYNMKHVHTAPPGKPDREGDFRVLAVHEDTGELVIGVFSDSIPQLPGKEQT